MGQIERIQDMEAILNRATETLERFDGALGELEGVQGDIARLSEYYGNAQWFSDVEDQQAGKLPDDLPCGVLGEDLAYNLFVDYRELAIRMLESATRALKEG